MAFNENDVVGFPPANPSPRQIDFASLVQLTDSSKEVPVVYAFGGQAPTMIAIGNGTPFEISSVNGYARMFVEFNPYDWLD